jgi:ABC-type transport system substrate-binding protein
MCALVLALPACTSAGSARSPHQNEPPRGGTLRIAALPRNIPSDASLKDPAFLDPRRPYTEYTFEGELFRCCLARTLLSYTSDERGTILSPDVAAQMPEVSSDGLTWTFRLKHGLHYAPPLDDVEITAPDLVRGIQRSLSARETDGSYHQYYSVIQGYEEYVSGAADTISGLEVLDAHTLRISLTKVTNDFGYRLALPGSGPIPASPSDPTAASGVAEGHDHGYGRYLISSGPYMLEGSEQLDPSKPPTEQRRASGLTGTTLTLVRNPSWEPASDDLRAAYVDRIVVRVMPLAQADHAIDRNRIDVMFAQDSLEHLDRYLADPSLAGRVHQIPLDNFVGYAPMNLAIPPFDDVHVRRAVNYAYDADRFVRISNRISFENGAFPFRSFGHIAPDGLEVNLLRDYAPYPFDMDAARHAMALSTYDRNDDGVCDDPACKHVFALDLANSRQTEQVWIDGLKQIGITLEIHRISTDNNRFSEISADPTRKIALNLGAYRFFDYPNLSTFFPEQFGDAGIGKIPFGNYSLVGARSGELQSWGYDVHQVRDVDAKIEECLALTGFAQARCWAELDQALMTDVVPWVPQVVTEFAQVVSERVVTFAVDQAFQWVAPDQIVLAPGSA